MENMTYKGSGVDYDSMDPFKRKCQLTAIKTSRNAERFGVHEIGWSRGESAFLLEIPTGFVTHVEEGLGTKNLVADRMYKITGKTYYNQIAQDTVAMIVNDMITLNSFPISVAMHLAVGDSNWFSDKKRTDDLISGWKNACNLARCIWGGGETPTLKDIVLPNAVVLSGSGIGYSKKISQPKVSEDYSIVIFESSGIHANGLTMARKLGQKGSGAFEYYQAGTRDGRLYGEALLDPTHIYVGVIEDLINAGADIGYSVNITGHGWRKIMRLNESFTYRMHTIPKPQPVFEFIQKEGNVSDEEAYGNLNMGAGFAIFVPHKDADHIVAIVNKKKYGFKAMNAGIVEKGEKQVIIEPKNLVFKGETLSVR